MYDVYDFSFIVIILCYSGGGVGGGGQGVKGLQVHFADFSWFQGLDF